MERTLWTRFGEATLKAPHAVQWLSDNAPQYTATASVLYAHELGLLPITTPAYSPQSNGLAEAFVKTLKRDYVDGTDLRDAETSWRNLVAGSRTTTPARRTRLAGVDRGVWMRLSLVPCPSAA